MGRVLNLASQSLQGRSELILIAVTVIYPRFELLGATCLVASTCYELISFNLRFRQCLFGSDSRGLPPDSANDRTPSF